jgi:hypothetical protein
MTLTMMDRIKARVLGSKKVLLAIALCTAGNTSQEDSIVTVRNAFIAGVGGLGLKKGADYLVSSVNSQNAATVNNAGIVTGR